MDDENLPALGPGVDLTRMAPLNQRRSVTFLNHYICHTANFLNKFSNVAEERLSQQQLEMQKIEVALNILEAKLASIPGLEDIGETTAPAPEPQQQESASSQKSLENADSTQEPIQADPAPADPNVVKVKDDTRYVKYFKMVAVGVPKMAVEGKMKAEGLDPSLLDNPDAPVPDGGQAPDEESDNESQSLSSGDDFSD